MNIIPYLIAYGLVVIFALIYCSHCEWSLHRFIMHKPLHFWWLNFRYPFERHALVHHRVFSFDESYHLRKEADKHTIPMAWWNGPVLILIGSLPALAVAFIADHFWAKEVRAWIHPWIGYWLFTGIIAGYYCAYESIHFCMHLPRLQRFIKGFPLIGPLAGWVFRKLNGHHLLHHRYMNRNFNVVLPLADLLLGTLLKRSPVKFKQALGLMVPDVQPV